jgi:NADH:ubiquinone oxidoreductase subunit K
VIDQNSVDVDHQAETSDSIQATPEPLQVRSGIDATTPPPTPGPTPARKKSKHSKQVADENGKRIFAWTILILATLVLMLLMHLDKIFTATTPTGGDNAVHVWTGDYLKRVLIPQGRLFGWSGDSYAGLPVLSSYFPLPMWTIVAMSYLIPYGMAFKIVSALGVFFLPVSVFRLGKKAELPWPEPILLAVGAFPFLLARHFKILGGNIMSTMAGEFSFSISLCLTVLYMGSLIQLLRTNRGRTRTTLLLAGLGLCHIVPAILAIGFTLSCTICELKRETWKRQITEVFRVGITALALAAFWIIPFGMNIPYTNSMDYERNTKWFRTLIPILPNSATLHTPADGVTLASVFFVCTLIGIAVGLRRRDRFVATMTLTMILAGVEFTLAPRGAMWNNRLLPAWFFCIYVLGAVGSFYTLRMLVTLWRRIRRTELFDSSGPLLRSVSAPAGVMKPLILAGLIAFGSVIPLGLSFNTSAPFVHIGISNRRHLPYSWANGNYIGTEGRKAYPEYQNIISVLKTLPCGRMFSEPGVKRYSDYGSSMSMAALPYWTKSCIQTIDGLYFEASQTTPFSYLTARWMSPNATAAQRRLPYRTFDMKTGVGQLRRLGVRYVLLSSKQAIAEAAKIEDLRFIVTTGPHNIYEIRENAVVVPLAVEPVVVTAPRGGRVSSFIDVGIAQWVRPTEFSPIIADTGPKYWKRAAVVQNRSVPVPVKAGTKPVEPKRGDGLSLAVAARTPRAIVPATVSNVRVGNHSLSFEVDEPGKPVLLRVSYFPNWKVTGASGPYRVGPNFMVVVPTQSKVALNYRYTGIELGSIGVTLVGIVMLLLGLRQSRAARRGRRGFVESPGTETAATGAWNFAASSAPTHEPPPPPQISVVLPPLGASTTELPNPSPTERSDQQFESEQGASPQS